MRVGPAKPCLKGQYLRVLFLSQIYAFFELLYPIEKHVDGGSKNCKTDWRSLVGIVIRTDDTLFDIDPLKTLHFYDKKHSAWIYATMIT